jgi:hypothetical protein
MGGPVFLKQVIIGREEEILITGPEDLEFHTNWNWIMPVWKKVINEMLDTSPKNKDTPKFIKAIDDADLKTLHKLIGNYCIDWCIRKQLKS